VLKSLKQFGYPFAVFFLVVGLLMGYQELITDPVTKENITVLSATVSVDDEPVVLVSPAELINTYQEDIALMVSELESILDQQKTYLVDSERIKEITEIEQKLMNTKVPEIYRDLHLKIFGIMHSVKQFATQESDQQNISDIQSKILTIKNQYAWF